MLRDKEKMTYIQRQIPCHNIFGEPVFVSVAIPTKEYDQSFHCANGTSDLPSEEILDQRELLSPPYKDLNIFYKKNGRR